MQSNEWQELQKDKPLKGHTYYIFYYPNKTFKDRVKHLRTGYRGYIYSQTKSFGAATHFMYVSSPSGDIKHQKPITKRDLDLFNFVEAGNNYTLTANKFNVSSSTARTVYLETARRLKAENKAMHEDDEQFFGEYYK